MTIRLAYFVSPHGFGHAARSAAVMAALHHLHPALTFDIFTRVPAWFFADSLTGPFTHHDLLTDIGLAQKNSLHEDLAETLHRLGNFLPFDPPRLQSLAAQLQQLGCRAVICDISPLGLAAGRAAGLPTFLIENFTWDWIYEGYLATTNSHRAELVRHIAYLGGWFEQADYHHIQAQPVCRPAPTAALTTAPISRAAQTPAADVRRRLGVPQQNKAVLLTMGGTPWQYTGLELLQQQPRVTFIIPGHGHEVERRKNLILLPNRSNFFHPDIVAAADAVIAKVGYSTLAEVYQAGVPLGYIPRPQFRESAVLADYIDTHLPGQPITEAEFSGGGWLARLPDLLAQPRPAPPRLQGAAQAAQFILQALKLHP
jgi:hypothetical protein